jgi:hypothetical protein
VARKKGRNARPVVLVEDRGLEPSRQSTGKTLSYPSSGAECGALSGDSALKRPSGDSRHEHHDRDLERVVAAWSTLPDATRQAILRLVDEHA